MWFLERSKAASSQLTPRLNFQRNLSMKRFSLVLFCLFLLISCRKEGSNLPNSDSLNSSSSIGGLNDSSGKRETNLAENLTEQIPLSNEQLKTWLPEEVGELKQRKLIIGHKQGIEMSGAIATYQEEGDEISQITLEVLDGAGTTGTVMLRSINQKLAMDYEEQTTRGYSKIYERDGIRVWEKLNSERHDSEVEFVLGNRFHFIFKGHEIEMEEIWAFVRETKKQMNQEGSLSLR